MTKVAFLLLMAFLLNVLNMVSQPETETVTPQQMTTVAFEGDQ